MSQADEVLIRLTKAMRAADKTFESVGGSTRRYVRDCLLPELESAGIRLEAAQSSGHPEEEVKKAVLNEREQCARILDREAEVTRGWSERAEPEHGKDFYARMARIFEGIAAAIRGRE